MEKRKSIPPHKPHATSQLSRLHGWVVGGYICAIAVVVVIDARPLLLSSCQTQEPEERSTEQRTTARSIGNPTKSDQTPSR